MKTVIITIIVVVGIMDLLLVMGAGKLEHEIEEREWRELMEKRERDGSD